MATAAVARRYASLAADHDWLARDLLRCGRSRPRVLERSVRQVDAVFGERGAGGLDGKISRNVALQRRRHVGALVAIHVGHLECAPGAGQFEVSDLTG